MELLVTIPLAMLIRSDISRRVVSVYTLFIFGFLQFVVVFLKEGLYEMIVRVVINGGILLFLSLGVILYLLLKYGRVTFATRRFIGSGDLFFLFFLTPAFTEMGFPKFLVISFLLSLSGWLVWFKRGEKPTIPLVATVGICYMFLVAIRFVLSMFYTQYSAL